MARYEIRIGLDGSSAIVENPTREIRRMLQQILDEIVDGEPLPNKVLRDTDENRIGSANTYGLDN